MRRLGPGIHGTKRHSKHSDQRNTNNTDRGSRHRRHANCRSVSREDFHPHDLHATVGEFGQLGEPGLHVGHGVVGLKISLIGVDLEEDEMARSLAVFLKEVDEVFRVASDQCHKWQRGGPQLGFLAGLYLHLGDD